MNDDDRKKVALMVGEGLQRCHHDACRSAGDALVRSASSTEAPKAAGGGPAQVATPAYRTNYDTIFGRRVEAGQA